jgi:cell division septal protein FtsQ
MKFSNIRRKQNLKLLLRRYSRPLRKLVILICAFLFIFFIVKTIRNKTSFYVNAYKYSGVVKYVNNKDFEHVIEENIKEQNFFTFKAEHLEQILKSNFLAIKTVKIHKRFPDALQIDVQERTPIATVVDRDQASFLIDEDGYVLGLTDTALNSLPTVNYENKLFVGQFIEAQIVPTALQILNSAKSSNVKVSSVSFKPDYTTFYSGSTYVFLKNDKNIPITMKILSQLLAQSAREGKKVSKVDLRYDKVIVSYE